MVDNVIGVGAPYLYDHQNTINSLITPSTMHDADNSLSWYFKRYLLQKAIAVFKWDMPEYWAKNYVLYTLYCWGYFAVVNTDKFGIIPQGCSLSGYDVMYQPTNAIIANPLLSGIMQPRIGVQTEIVRLQPDYGSIMDKVGYYASMMALCAVGVGTNLVNSKLAYVFGCQNKSASESFKKMFDDIASGEAATFISKDLFNEDGSPNWMMFNQDLRSSYIAGDILEDMRKIEIQFLTDLGIPNSNTEKKERLIEAEVESNDVEVKLWADLALEELQKSCKKVRDMFGIELNVDWRYNPVREEADTYDESEA